MSRKKKKAKNSFFLVNGWKLNTMLELVNALDIMDQKTFSHHVNEEKHDFAAWIEHSFNKKDLSEGIPTERKDMQIYLLKHLVGR